MQTPERLALIGGSILLSSTLVLTLKGQASNIIPKVSHSISNVYDHIGDAQKASDFDGDFQRAQQKDWKTGTWGTSKYYIDDQGNLYIGKGQLGGNLHLYLDNDTIASLRTVNIVQPVQGPDNGFQLMDGLWNVTAIHGLDNMDTSQTGMMAGMFADDYNLNYVDVSHFNMSKVDNIGDMFSGDRSLHSLNIQSFGYNYSMGNLFQSTGINELTVGKNTNLWGGQGLQSSKWQAPDGSIGDYPDGSHPGTWTRR